MLKRIGFLILSLLLMTGCTTETKKKSFNIVVTNFPCYDFVRAITKNDPDISIKMLIKPGMDSHSYEPTPQDMVAIKESDLFFYVGGESDDWVDSLLADMDSKRIVKMLDLVSHLQHEEHVEGMEECVLWTKIMLQSLIRILKTILNRLRLLIIHLNK